MDSLESHLKVVRESSHPLAKEFLQTLEKQAEIVACLLKENEGLASQPLAEGQCRQWGHAPEAGPSWLPAEGQQPQQEPPKAKRNGNPGPRKSPMQYLSLLWTSRTVSVQVRVTGQTGDCEHQFLKDVSHHLSDHSIHLRVEDYRENSGHLLLVFCPVASRMGSDIENALEGLGNVQKVLLVVLHHKPKDNSRLFVDTKTQVQHPALVCTVHARYTVQDGFYACQMNEEAVAAAAEAIKKLS